MPNATALVFLVVLALTPSAAYSHEPAAHGGLIAEVDAHHLELVVGEGELVVYVTDAQNAPVETIGAQGTAVVLSTRHQTSVNLAPGGQNTLRGTGPFQAEQRHADRRHGHPARDARLAGTLRVMTDKPRVSAVTPRWWPRLGTQALAK